MNKRGLLLSAAVGTLSLAAATPAVQAVPLFAIDDVSNQHLITFDSATPNSISSIPLTGLAANEKLIGIDFRVNTTGVNTGTLYGVGSFGRIYTINPSTGAATSGAQITTTLNGTEFGVDFNPAADALRIVSDLDQNLAVNPDTGATTVQLPLNSPFGNPNVTNIAYNQNDLNTGTSTTLFGIDTFSNQLVRIGDVNAPATISTGVVTPVGSLIGIDPTSIGGFDIGFGAGTAYLASRNAAGGGSLLSTVDTTTGQASLVGFIGNPEDNLVIKGLTVSAVGVPEPATFTILGLGAMGLLARRRRA